VGRRERGWALSYEGLLRLQGDPEVAWARMPVESLGLFRDPFEIGDLWDPLGLFRVVLRVPWAPLETVWALLERPGDLWQAAWDHSGAPWVSENAFCEV